ncbi:terminase [Burkholderia cenocepacia]|nr:terminase [Burkholderia cenocepacia]MDR8064668.1 terminase [Burkholderia cenocepacia]
MHDAFNKVTEFKNETKNHALTQVLSYRIGDKEAYRRADDLADCFAYGVIQTLVPDLT